MAKNGKLPYLPFYVADYLADAKVQRMSTLEQGAYLRLLFFSWSDELHSLPDDDEELACLTLMTLEEFQNHRLRIMAPFHIEEDGRWHQKRITIEWSECERRHAVFKEAGRKGGLRQAEARLKGGSSNHLITIPSHLPLSPSSSSSENNLIGTDECSLIDSKQSMQAAARKSCLMTNTKLKELQENPAYKQLDLTTEAFKFNEWCEANKKPKSIKRFVNWINRI
jgi:uncharacterized protein YdaU (DUF1376 family)